MPTTQLSSRLGSEGLNAAYGRALNRLEEKKMEVQGVLIFVFEGVELVCEKVYFDHATVLRQLGVIA